MFDIVVEKTLADLFKEYRGKTGDSQEVLGAKIGVGGQSISNLETGVTQTMKLENLQSFSKLTGIPYAEIAAAVEAGKNRAVYDPAIDEVPKGVDTTRSGKTKKVPEFKSGIGASPWIDRFPEDTRDFTTIEANDDGEMVLVILGDCMAPRFKDGDRIIFSRAIIGRKGIDPGASCYVQFADGRATFKRVFVDKKDTNMYLLRCWNRKKYPKDIRVHRDQVSKVMRAVRRIEDLNC